MKQIESARIDYNGGQEWYAYLMDADGVQQYGRSAHTLGKLLAALKEAHPDVKIEYTLRGWQQNVTEFERSRSCRRC